MRIIIIGGVARKTRETIILCEAAGFDKIFVETVGVGQSETACHSMVDFFLLLQVAGTGDELQGIKRGIMEISDGIVINKCDGENVDDAMAAGCVFKPKNGYYCRTDYDVDKETGEPVKMWKEADLYCAKFWIDLYKDEKFNKYVEQKFAFEDQ